MILWRPIAELPDALKDGRAVLLWETNNVGQAEIASWAPSGSWQPRAWQLEHGVWCDREGSTIHGITHFAEISAPNTASVELTLLPDPEWDKPIPY